MTSNIADQFADKTIDSIRTNNQKDATKFWMELLNHAKQTSDNRTDELLSTIVMKAYSGKRTNFYPLLEFIIKNNITLAYPKLYDALNYYDHIFDGQEVFVLAQYLRQVCGESTQLYGKLPLPVRRVIGGPVLFKNQDNRGYIIGTEHTPCKTREECYANPKTEAYVFRTSNSLRETDVLKNPRAQWRFTPPITMDMWAGFNGTRMAWGFHLKNVAENKFLITKLRMTTFFLRNDTNFDSYYVGDLQCQYQPMLVRGEEGDSIRLAVVEKYVPKREFIYGGNWGKKADKVQLGRRGQFREEMGGMLWEVKSVMKEDEEDDGDINGKVDSEMSSEPKCQF